MRRLTLLLSIALAMASRPVAQESTPDEECALECERAKACAAGVGAALRGDLAREEVPRLDEVDRQSWASSTLAADGKNPLRGESPDRVGACAFNGYARWTCKYAAGRAQDGDPRSAWCEGKPDDGAGEVLVARVDTSKPVEIWAGFGASKALHAANGRPREVEVYVLQATERRLGQCGDAFERVAVLARHRVGLRDVDGYQPLPVPAHRLAGDAGARPGDRSFVAVEIVSTYPGARYRDTCVSEIRNRPGR